MGCRLVEQALCHSKHSRNWTIVPGQDGRYGRGGLTGDHAPRHIADMVAGLLHVADYLGCTLGLLPVCIVQAGQLASGQQSIDCRKLFLLQKGSLFVTNCTNGYQESVVFGPLIYWPACTENLCPVWQGWLRRLPMEIQMLAQPAQPQRS